MAGNRLRLESEDGILDLEILEETTIQGVKYILLTDALDGKDGECYIMKDISPSDSSEAVYIFASDKEADLLMGVFTSLLEEEGIVIER